MSNEKQTWEMSYDEIFKVWSERHSFGAKGAMTPSEAIEVHKKWKRLGTLARRGLL